MPRGKTLTMAERIRISVLDGQGEIQTDIAKALNRSPTVVRNYLMDPTGYGTKKKKGPAYKLSKSETRRAVSLARTGKFSCADIANSLSTKVSKQTVWRCVKRSQRLKYSKMKETLQLLQTHKEARMSWAVERVHWKKRWNRVIFSDEKRFNLDGPDMCRCYWRDVTEKPKKVFKRHSGGGGVMIWGGMSVRGKTELAFIRNTLNSEDYARVLEDYMLPFAYALHDSTFTFMQDNASIHSSRVMKEWFRQLDVEVLPWPARSPDVNPIENIWSILARRVYAGGKQYSTVAELEDAIRACWDSISLDTIRSVIDSMPKRCVLLIKGNGTKIPY